MNYIVAIRNNRQAGSAGRHGPARRTLRGALYAASACVPAAPCVAAT